MVNLLNNSSGGSEKNEEKSKTVKLKAVNYFRKKAPS